MQTTTTTSNNRSPVHIKVAYENEFRRFLLTPVSFEQLQTTLKALFNLNAEFRIKFQDDENDWVLLSTDQELVYATELSGSPLRLQLTLLETTEYTKPEVQADGERRRGGRGCRGGKGFGFGGGRGGCQSHEERLAKSSSRLADRINQLEAKLNSEEKLPSEREEVIRWRLSKLQEKLATVKAMKESLADSNSNSDVEKPKVEEEEKTGEDKPSCHMRGGRRGGRGCHGGWRRAMDGDERQFEERTGRKPRVDPEILAKFRQCKADLRAARESGDAEKIESCLEAVKIAKAAKWEARAALRAQSAQVCNDEERV